MNDLELTITVRDGGRIGARLQDGTEVAGQLELDRSHYSLIRVFQDWLSQGQISKREELEAFGALLYHTLFVGEISMMFQDGLARTPSGGSLRVLLSFGREAADLANLPWEYLYCPDTETERGFFLSTRMDLVLSRYIPLMSKIGGRKLEPGEKPLRILIVISNPEDLGPVISAPVIERIEKLRESYDIKIDILEKPTVDNFLDTLEKTRPHVLHYIGHGRFSRVVRKGEIALLHPDEKSVQWFPNKTFAEFLHQVFIPRLVFLHLCEGATTDLNVFYTSFAGLAPQLILSTVQAVVAMQYPITNRAAIAFSGAFYSELAKGKPVDYAVQRGRWSITIDDPKAYSSRAFGTPVLYMHSRDAIIMPDVVNDTVSREVA